MAFLQGLPPTLAVAMWMSRRVTMGVLYRLLYAWIESLRSISTSMGQITLHHPQSLKKWSR